MRIDPALRALRGDGAPQREAQDLLGAAGDAWRARTEWQPLRLAFEAYGKGAPLDQCAPLHALISNATTARRFADAFVAWFLPMLGQAAWGQFPLRHSVNGSVSTLLLASSGRAALLLLTVDGARQALRPRAQAAGFVAGERHEAVLAGVACALKVHCRPLGSGRADIRREPLVVARGDCLSLDTARETVLVEEVTQGGFVTLRLQRRAEGVQTARDYALADGALVHQSAGDAEQSRAELAMALLAQMGRKDAAPLLAARVARGPDGLRWQALRAWLALDTQQGFAALCGVAENPADPLAAHADAARETLVRAYPVLAGIGAEAVPCR